MNPPATHAAKSWPKHAARAALWIAIPNGSLHLPLRFRNMPPRNEPYVKAPNIPILPRVATGKLDARTLPTPAPKPDVSAKLRKACSFHRVRSSPELLDSLFSTIVDPKEFDEKNFVDIKGNSVIIPPNSFALARTVEYFRIPRNVLTVCLGKSTYARCGILVNVTPFEPEWEGYVTLEFSNTTPLPAKIYANEGVAQVIFFESDEECETSYKDRGGKYQGQRGVTLPKM